MRRSLPATPLLAVLAGAAVIAASCGASDTSTPTSPPEAFEPATSERAPAAADAPTSPPGAFEPATSERAPVASDAPISDLANGMNAAGFDLLRTQEIEGNHVLSPSSIGHAVLMLRGAADASTATAIDDQFSFPTDEAADQAWNAIDQAIIGANNQATGWDEGPTPIVTIADRIWPALGASPDQAWLDDLARFHGAGVEPIDVSNAPASAARINEWVSDQTEGLIPTLLPDGFINGSTVLVLTDTLYFEADWQLPFLKYGTERRDFTKLDGSTVNVELMRELEGTGAHGSGDGYVGAELPYLGGDYSMLVIVPDKGRFPELRNRMSTDLLAEVDANFDTGPYELMIPRWTANSALDLMPWLTKAGVAPGNFPGIADGSFLGGAVHGADIAVDEWGTVAAAATAFGVQLSGPPEPELQVIADRPFLYLIRHVDTGLVLFAGQVTDPTPS